MMRKARPREGGGQGGGLGDAWTSPDRTATLSSPVPPPGGGAVLALLTSTVPFIPGWMWQSYSKVPAVVNVRATDMLAFAPVIASGAPAGELSKKTLWATSPKVKVTVPPTPIATFAGVNVFNDVAFTAAAMGGAPAVLLDDPAIGRTSCKRRRAPRPRW